MIYPLSLWNSILTNYVCSICPDSTIRLQQFILVPIDQTWLTEQDHHLLVYCYTIHLHKHWYPVTVIIPFYFHPLSTTWFVREIPAFSNEYCIAFMMNHIWTNVLASSQQASINKSCLLLGIAHIRSWCCVGSNLFPYLCTLERKPDTPWYCDGFEE